MVKSKNTRGHGKVEFQKNIEFIKTQISHNNTASEIYRSLREKNLITVGLVLFRRYIRELKSELAASEAKQTTPNTDSTRVQRHDNGDVVSVGNVEQKSFFKPSPIHNMDDEFASDQEANNG